MGGVFDQKGNRKGLRRIRASHLHLLLATMVVVAAAIFALNQNQNVFDQKLRSDVLSKSSLVRAKLEGSINANIQLVRGLVASIETNPDIGQAEFSELVGSLLTQELQIRHIAAAPDLVVKLIHPIEGNERAIGLDYRTSETQRDAVFKARNSGELVLAGPVDLVQGGQGFIGRFPVFSRNAMGVREFWGIVSAIVDVEQLYRQSGLLDADLAIEVAIVGRDAAGGRGERFFGPASILADDPVTVDVLLPSGTWQIAARPKGGWDQPIPGRGQLYAWLIAAALLVLGPTFIMGRLMDERQRNIADMRERKLELEQISRRLRLAVQASRIGIWEMDVQNGELIWDDRMNELYDYPQDAGIRNYPFWARRLHPDDKVRAEADFSVAMRETGRYHSDYRLVLEDGSIRHIRAIGSVFQDETAPPRIVGVNWDVSEDVERAQALNMAILLSEARNAELESIRERIEFNALHDSLTGLPNRRFLDETIAEHAKAFADGSEVAAILQIDLDRFKEINDTLGHAAGDAMLVHAANVLRQSVWPSDFVARVGGDEFVVVRRARNAALLSAESLADLAATIIVKLQEPTLYEEHECRIGGSVGIATDADSLSDPTRLLVNADIALYRAKRNGRNCFQFFSEALQAEIITTKQIADDIRQALDRGEFVPYYQPQFDAQTFEIIGVEALARWEHPQKGLLGPSYFMKVAEELDVVHEIDRRMLEATVAQLGIWELQGLRVPQASVNVSARRLHNDELLTSLRKLDIEPGRISFELVESIFLDEHDDRLMHHVDELKSIGIDVEIDDFGTGYASIVSLLKLKPQRLKIDRQLVQPIVGSLAQRQLLGSIIEMGHSLGIQVLAEGVETMEHAQVLRNLGCDALQGFALAKPLPASQIVAFAQGSRLRRAS
ncbi:EAL domain-containing protein [Mesorhizobium sp. YIM 152430]|uniref:bifunctional diguanylate cyclase/phosphodiesterase n=1 Tax=Mesorhizobium sp. YIM 152430 TaxID=3031761 RepID=UPI0023DC94E6|nr:EAL domain-containing protein [Mesorhizobium sp. YIM 152430]MDF1601754.1 EAL domain-containing protein [Mesorhizobium sp. YIM 152430]